MAKLFTSLPKDAVRQGEELYRNYSKNVATKDLSSIFIVSTKNGLEFIDKNSLRAFWLRLICGIRTLFGIGDQAFNVQKNIEAAAKILKKATKCDDKFFKTSRTNLIELGLVLKQIKSHVVKSRSLKGKKVNALKQAKISLHVPEVAAKYHFASLQELRSALERHLQEALPTLSKQECDETVSALVNRQDASCVLDGLKRASLRHKTGAEADYKDYNGLRLALMKALPLLCEEASRTITGVLTKLEPPKQAVDATDTSLERFAKIFGDAFIEDSGFEGDYSTAPYATLFSEFLDLQKNAGDLKTILDSHINLLTTTPNKENILKALSCCKETPKRVLLLGGWEKHAVVYEIATQENGKYSFRVFNEGNGINYHDEEEHPLKPRYSPTLAVKDIPEKLLFNYTFLHSLKALTLMPEDGINNTKPDVLLAQHLIPMLGGKKEELDSKMCQFVSPQRSGTCTYRSLMAFFASSMPKDRYKLFKIEFKLHMLRKYLPELKNPVTDYDKARRQYNVVQRSIEKFANGVKKLQSELATSTLKELEHVLVEYQMSLAHFQRALQHFEKEHFAFECTPVKAQRAISITYDYPSLQVAIQRNLDKACSHRFNAGRLCEQIDKAESSEKALHTYVHNKEQLSTIESLFVADYLFRKIGSIEALRTMEFQNPAQAQMDFCTLLNRIAKEHITKTDQSHRALTRGIFLFCCFGIERTTALLPENARIIREGNLNIVGPHKAIGQQQTADPFWTRIYSEILAITKKRDSSTICFNNFAIDETIRATVKINKALVEDISSWWEQSSKCTESIQKDRKAQELELKKRLDDGQKLLTQFEQQPAHLKKQNQEAYEKLKIALGNLPLTIANSNLYWPKGIEQTGDLGGMSQKSKAEFLLGSSRFFQNKIHEDSPFPEAFDRFRSSAILAANIFNQYHPGFSTDNYYSRFEWERFNKNLWPARFDGFNNKHEPFEDDLYLPHLQNDKLKPLYQALAGTRVAEQQQARDFQLLEAQHKSFGIGRDDAKELFSICATEEMQLSSLVSYLQSEMLKLQSNDWINIVHSRLFQSDLLAKELANPTTSRPFIALLKEFFKEALKNARSLQDVKLQANLLWLAANIQEYIGPVSQLIDDTTYQAYFKEAAKVEHAENWPTLYEALLASYRKPLEMQSSNRLLGHAIFAHIRFSESPAGQNEFVRLRVEAAELAREQLKTRLDKLTDQQICAILNDHVSEHLPGKITFRTDYRKGHFIGSDGSSLSLYEGKLIPADPSKVPHYSNHLTESLRKTLITKGIYSKKDSLEHLRCHTQNGCTYIQDSKKGIEVAVATFNNSLYIKTAEYDWQIVTTSSSVDDIPKILYSKYISVVQNQQQRFLDKTTFKPLYERTEGVLRPVAAEYAHLVVNNAGINPFKSFEDDQSVLLLSDDSQIVQKIDYTRHGLVFRLQNGRYVLEQDPSWHIAKTQYLPHFGPTTGYLLLENEKGEKKALLPVWKAKHIPEPRKQELSLHFPYIYDIRDASTLNARHVAYNVTDEGLIPTTLEARYYLAKIYLEKGRVHDACALLSGTAAENCSKKCSKEEEEHLLELATTQYSHDTGSGTIRVKMQALAILEKNALQFQTANAPTPEQTAEDERIFTKKVTLWARYHNRLGHIAPIPKEDELAILRSLDGKCKNPVLRNRIDELTGVQQDLKPSVEEKFLESSLPSSSGPPKIPDLSSPFEKMAYQAARKAGRFPFDPLAMTYEEMQTYYPMLEMEVESIYKASTAIESGLYQTLYHLAFFSKEERIQKAATYLIQKIGTNDGFWKWIFSSPVTISRKKQLNHPRTLDGTKPAQNQADYSAHFLQNRLLRAQDADLLHGLLINHMVEHSEELAPSDSSLFDPNCPQAADKATKKQFQERTLDLMAAQNATREKTYSLKNASDHAQLKNSIKIRYEEESKKLALDEKLILHAVHSALTYDTGSHLEFMANKRTLPSLKELTVLAAKNDALKSHYPELSDELATTLKTVLKELLFAKKRVLHYRRALEAQDINQLGHILAEKQAYTANDPDALIFAIIETELSITLRSEQVELVRKVAKGQEKNQSIVLQLIMGAGKTSVLQPLLAYLFATPHNLSTVIVPEALVEPVREGLSRILGSSFQQSVFMLPYDRELARNKAFLTTYLEKLEEVQKRSGVILMSPRCKHSIITSLYEAYYDEDDRSELIAKIVQKLEAESVSQVDEIDSVMNPLVIFKYPLGHKEIIDVEQASMVSRLVANLKEHMNRVSIDFVHSKDAQALTEGSYKEVVEPFLVEQAKILLGEKTKLHDEEGYLKHFLTQTTPYDHEKTQDMQLAFRKKMIAWIEKMLPKKDDQDMLAILAQTISQILPSSLFKECGIHYGMDTIGHKTVARPYEAAGSPKPTQFSNPFEQVVYSTQMSLYYGLSEEASCALLQELQTKAKLEAEKNSVAIEVTEAHKNFCEILGTRAGEFSLLERPIRGELYAAFHTSISKQTKWILHYLKGYVYPQIGRHDESLSTTAETLVGCAKVSSGYTGTLHKEILACGVEILQDVGTDSKTINAVLHKNPAITISAKNHVKNVVDALLQDREKLVYIDSAGWLKDEKIESFASEYLKQELALTLLSTTMQAVKLCRLKKTKRVH